MPPAASGVADYSAVLLRLLRGRHLRPAEKCAKGRVEPGASRADVHLYHLGNNQLHAGIYARALRTPGVAVLHDAVLQHFFLGSLHEPEYVREFVFNYGP